MTVRRRVPLTRPLKTAVLTVTALAAIASSAVACGALPGSSGNSGDPVTVMTWAPDRTTGTDMPGMPAMARAYARWVNNHGGLNGRPLKVLTCNDHNDSVGAANCARRAVRENVAAVVGSYSQHGQAFLSPLEAAGIPYIGGYGLTEEEFVSPMSFPVNGGVVALLAGNGRQLAEVCERVALVRPDTLAGDLLPELLNSGLAQGDRKPATDILAAEDSGDYSEEAEQALTAAGADPSLVATLGREGAAERAREGCVTAALGDRTDSFFDSFRRTQEDGQKVQISSVLGSVDQTSVDRTGGASGPYEGAYVTSWYPAADDARWDPMRKVIREEAFGDHRIDPANAGVQTTWIAYTVFKQVVESLGDGEVNARTVARALNDGVRVDTGGLTPTLSWRFEDTVAASEFPRLVNANVTYQVVKDGRLVAARKSAVDVSRTLEEAA
ncbi:ABC transporter substrate-binding protein [Streptomyces sp. B-S-A8]|uniref:ABC transporter substrate-binding protein n=1 Tax=Streptomyces solicavernae TaxID=3043614 RepID=A0ABT6RPV9_9ACTN|nr:ABC transporter substrate-binding protein [Streptomyces sp. B-S-A8]MDI3386466.1 ABC transporter substrate-binding protein [Streptomyces sp. B-S-A8]